MGSTFGIAILAEGVLQEDMLDGELDIERALALLADPAAREDQKARLAASAQSEIARQATTYLGPVAATLTDHYGALTEDPFLVYRAVATHIQAEKERTRFLAGAPARPIRRLVPGDAVGWFGLEPPARRRRAVPTEAAVLAFTHAQLKALLAEPEGERLIGLLVHSRAMHGLPEAELRERLDRLVG